MNKTTLITILISACNACITIKAPPIIDRQTILENEAAGDWPEIEKRFYIESKNPGPIGFTEKKVKIINQKVYNILDPNITIN